MEFNNESFFFIFLSKKFYETCKLHSFIYVMWWVRNLALLGQLRWLKGILDKMDGILEVYNFLRMMHWHSEFLYIISIYFAKKFMVTVSLVTLGLFGASLVELHYSSSCIAAWVVGVAQVGAPTPLFGWCCGLVGGEGRGRRV